MVAFLQSHKIETLEDLLKMVEDTKKRRSDNIHNQRELNAKRKKMSNIVDIYQAYKPYAEYLKKYESLSGRQKQSHDFAKDDAILGELAEIADKVAMVQRAKAKQNEILPNLGEKKRIKKERGSYGRE